MKQAITDIQVKIRALRRRNIHSLVVDSFARKASVSHSKLFSQETLQQQQSRRHLFFSDEASKGHCGSFIVGACAAREPHGH